MENGAFIKVLFGIGVIGLIVWALAVNVGGGNHDAADQTAHDYASELGIEVKAVSCTRMDTDGDGYVACTIMPAGDGAQPIMVECAGAMTFNDGCRKPKASIRVHND